MMQDGFFILTSIGLTYAAIRRIFGWSAVIFASPYRWADMGALARRCAAQWYRFSLRQRWEREWNWAPLAALTADRLGLAAPDLSLWYCALHSHTAMVYSNKTPERVPLHLYRYI